jgi:pentatricopeptide repeat protein
MEHLIESKDRVGLERFLASLEFESSLTKLDRYDLMLQAKTYTFDAPAIKNILADMHKNGLRPSQVGLRALIQYHVETGDLEGAEQLCLSLPKYGQSGLDSYMITTMIAGWGKKGLIERAEKLFNAVPELHNSNIMVTAMMSVYFEAKMYEKAIKLYDSLRTVAKPDAVMKKLRVKCLVLSGLETAALAEWNSIKHLLHSDHWLDMAKVFSSRFPFVVLQMAKESIPLFGIAKGVPELVALAISKSCQSVEDITSLFDTMVKFCLPAKQNLLTQPMLAMADRLSSMPLLKPYIVEQMSKFESKLSQLPHLAIHAKLNS